MGHASVPGLVPDPFAVPPPDDGSPGWMVRALATRGISRRRFLQWCSAMTAAMALPKDYTPRVVTALETGKKVRSQTKISEGSLSVSLLWIAAGYQIATPEQNAEQTAGN